MILTGAAAFSKATERLDRIVGDIPHWQSRTCGATSTNLCNREQHNKR